MSIEVAIFCPLGKVCEEVKDGKIHRCGFYTTIAGIDASGADVNDSRCGIAWLPTLLVENTLAVRHTTSATETFKNEMVNQQATAIQLVKQLEG